MKYKSIPWAKPFITNDEIKSVTDCMISGWVAMGNKVKEFEENFSNKLDIKYAIAFLSSDTSSFVTDHNLIIDSGRINIVFHINECESTKKENR